MNTDCILDQNPLSGHVGSHTNYCAFGTASDVVHLAPEFHVRIGGYCALICRACQDGLTNTKSKSYRKEAIVRELTAEGN